MFRLAHPALPGLDLAEASLRTQLLGAELAAPVMLMGDRARTATEHGLGPIANDLAPDRPRLWLEPFLHRLRVGGLGRRRAQPARPQPGAPAPAGPVATANLVTGG